MTQESLQSTLATDGYLGRSKTNQTITLVEQSNGDRRPNPRNPKMKSNRRHGGGDYVLLAAKTNAPATGVSVVKTLPAEISTD